MGPRLTDRALAAAPVPRIVGPGMAVTLQAQMAASEPLSYQWLHDGMPIAGATNATMPLPGMSAANAGRYTVIIRNSVGTVANFSTVVGMFSIQHGDGVPRLMIAGPTGTHFGIELSDTLGSASNWRSMTNFVMGGVASQATDVSTDGLHAGFYRAVMLP